MAKFNKGDTLTYLGSNPYILADEQKIDSNGQEVTIKKDLHLDESLFMLSKPAVDLDKLHENALHENVIFDKMAAAKAKADEKAKQEKGK